MVGRDKPITVTSRCTEQVHNHNRENKATNLMESATTVILVMSKCRMSEVIQTIFPFTSVKSMKSVRPS